MFPRPLLFKEQYTYTWARIPTPTVNTTGIVSGEEKQMQAFGSFQLVSFKQTPVYGTWPPAPDILHGNCDNHVKYMD